MTQIKDKKRILFVLPSLTPGGAERVLINLMNDLDRSIYAPTLVSLTGEGVLKELVDDHTPVHYLKARSVPLSLIPLLKQFRISKPDIVVSTMAHTNFAVLLLRPLFPRVKFIVREAITPSYLLQTHPRRAFLIRLLYKILYPLATRVISPARMIMTEFKNDLGLRVKNHVWLPNPVDVEKIRRNGAAARPLAGLNFIAAGRLHPQKGFDRLIEALRGFDPGCPWSLFILGEGPERKTLEKLIQDCGLSRHIKLSGHVVTPWPYYAASDAFILCSRWEGLPNVVLESLASGTKVLALREAGGIQEIADLAPDSVTIVPDMNSLVTAMAKITPDSRATIRPSLLPAIFKKSSVNKRFLEILNGT
jgi:glycosyltransferase involved in cell wall biosynthesis